MRNSAVLVALLLAAPAAMAAPAPKPATVDPIVVTVECDTTVIAGKKMVCSVTPASINLSISRGDKVHWKLGPNLAAAKAKIHIFFAEGHPLALDPTENADGSSDSGALDGAVKANTSWDYGVLIKIGSGKKARHGVVDPRMNIFQ